MIWFNGGPGCSSMDGIFMENGAYRIDDSNKVIFANHTWILDANVLYGTFFYE